jgi:myo-inositol-1-phosphate synthase
MGIRVAIAGVGNCASALIQGIEFYKNSGRNEEVPGVMHTYFGKYHIKDIEFVGALDVNKNKIGKDLSHAIHEEPNSCDIFAEVPNLGVKVAPAPISDGVAPHMVGSFNINWDIEPVNVTKYLKETNADMLINYLPVGSAKATRLYAEACLESGCAFVNCIPEFIASDPA